MYCYTPGHIFLMHACLNVIFQIKGTPVLVFKLEQHIVVKIINATNNIHLFFLNTIM